MKFNLKAVAATAGILWAVALFLLGLGNILWSGYGITFLQAWAAVYPGYHASGGFFDLLVGTLYALVDGAVVGLVFGWLYNLLAVKTTKA